MDIYFENCTAALDYAQRTKGFGLYHSAVNNPNPNIHTHDCCEIMFCVKGGNHFLIDDKIYEVEDGDIFTINQFEAHKITFNPDLDVERFIIQIHPEFIYSASTEETDLSQCFYVRHKNTSNKITLSDEERKNILNMLKKLSVNYEFGDDVMKNSIMLQILTLINEKFIHSHDASLRAQLKSLPLNAAILYINEHLDDELTLKKIAQNSYISVNQLCKLFKVNLGTTVMKYITGKRISEAKKLLKNGYSVSDTAFMCGFRDYSNFIRTFTSSVGISPGKYAKSSF